MIAKEPVLVIFVKLIDRIPYPETAPKQKRGRQETYSERLMLKALVIMIIRRLYSAYSLLAFLDQETEPTQQRRDQLTENGRFPSRRTWERRLAKVPDRLPALIGCFGRYLVAKLHPWGKEGKAAAIDRTALRAKGGVWHKKDREAAVVPHSSIDTAAHWSKSGHHGWWYGWKLHLATTVVALWIPLAAQLTPANVADQEEAPALVRTLDPSIRFILGDIHYNEPGLRLQCEQEGRFLVATQAGTQPRTDPGAKVQQLFHRLRSKAHPRGYPTVQWLVQKYLRMEWSGPCAWFTTNQAFCSWRRFPLSADFALSVRASLAFGERH